MTDEPNPFHPRWGDQTTGVAPILSPALGVLAWRLPPQLPPLPHGVSGVDVAPDAFSSRSSTCPWQRWTMSMKISWFPELVVGSIESPNWQYIPGIKMNYAQHVSLHFFQRYAGWQHDLQVLMIFVECFCQTSEPLPHVDPCQLQ